MFVLRRIVGTGVFTDDTQAIGFLSGSIKTDVGEFRALAGSPARSDLAVAAQVYTGPLLDQFPSVAADFDQWLERARSDLTNSAIEMLVRLSHMCFADGHVALGVSTAERMLALDPLREDSHRALMLAYQQAGRRADAIRQSNICRDTLRREWGANPSPETEALIAQIRGEDCAGETRLVQWKRRHRPTCSPRRHPDRLGLLCSPSEPSVPMQSQATSPRGSSTTSSFSWRVCENRLSFPADLAAFIVTGHSTCVWSGKN